MKFRNMLLGILILSILIFNGCTKTVYVENTNICPQKCTTMFYEKYGTCTEHLASMKERGIYIDFKGEDFNCDGSRMNNNECSCSCSCGLIYKFP